MKKIDFSNVQEAAEGNRPGEGGYTCRIIKAEDVPDKEYLRSFKDTDVSRRIDFKKENQS